MQGFFGNWLLLPIMDSLITRKDKNWVFRFIVPLFFLGISLSHYSLACGSAISYCRTTRPPGQICLSDLGLHDQYSIWAYSPAVRCEVKVNLINLTYLYALRFFIVGHFHVTMDLTSNYMHLHRLRPTFGGYSSSPRPWEHYLGNMIDCWFSVFSTLDGLSTPWLPPSKNRP